MRFITVKVTRDTNHSQTDTVNPWEVPILELVHDSGNVVPQGEVDIAERELPDAVDEFQRLKTRYGKDVETGLFIVEAVYGQSRAGLTALKAEIEKERGRAATPSKTADADDMAA